MTDNPYKQAELSSADLHQLGELYAKQYSDYLNTKDNSDLVKKFNDLYAKYAIDLGVYNIDNYMVAYKNDKVAKQAADAAKKAYDDAASQGKDTVALYTAYRQAADSYAKSHADFVKNVATPFTNYSKYTDATPDADKGAGAWTPANAVVKEATTPVTPNQPNQQPTTPVAPSDNNNTNNNTQAQTLYVSYSEHPTWKVATLNDNGVYTDNYVDQNTAITVMQSKTVNGELLYKIADNQWIPAKYTAKQASANAEEAASGVATLNEVPGHPTWKINMLDASGHYTNVYLNPNTAWKVFGKKTINGEVCYRLGSQSQWVPAKYLSLN